MPVESVRVVLHSSRIRALALSEPVWTFVRSIAETIRDSAGSGISLKELRGSTDRARVIVYTKTKKARQAEAESRVLTRAVASGRQR